MVLKRFPKKSRGFSLLEVIIGVAILSTGIVLILQALTFSARITGVSCDTVKAIFLAEDKWQEIDFKVGKKIIDKASSDSGQRDGDDFKWSYELAALEDNPDLYKLDLNINWQRGSREEKLELNTWLLKNSSHSP